MGGQPPYSSHARMATPMLDVAARRSALTQAGVLRAAAEAASDAGSTLDDVLAGESVPRVAAARESIRIVLGRFVNVARGGRLLSVDAVEAMIGVPVALPDLLPDTAPQPLPPVAPELPPRVASGPRRLPNFGTPDRVIAKAAPPTPNQPAVSIVVVPVVRLLREDQHFRCLPYATTLSARVCIQRQFDAGDGTRGYGRRLAPVRDRMRHRVGCKLGAVVVGQLKLKTGAQ